MFGSREELYQVTSALPSELPLIALPFWRAPRALRYEGNGMELDSLRAGVLLLSCLCVAALATALLTGGGLRSVASPARFTATMRVIGPRPASATLAQEEVERALELARSSVEFRELLEEGFEPVDARLVLKCKVHVEDSVLAIGALSRLYRFYLMTCICEALTYRYTLSPRLSPRSRNELLVT